jgi:hypothetical protein
MRGLTEKASYLSPHNSRNYGFLDRDFFVRSMVFGIVQQICSVVPGHDVALFNAVPHQHATFEHFDQTSAAQHPALSQQLCRYCARNVKPVCDRAFCKARRAPGTKFGERIDYMKSRFYRYKHWLKQSFINGCVGNDFNMPVCKNAVIVGATGNYMVMCFVASSVLPFVVVDNFFS